MKSPNTYDLLNKILEKQESIKEDISDIKIIQGQHHVTLEEHMRRSLANEEAVELLKNEIKPIQSHIYGVNAIAKSIALIAAISGIIVSIIKVIEFFQ